MPVPAADACGVFLHASHQRDGGVRQLAVALEHHAPAHEVG
jgi:hypothetical protein